MSTAVKQPYAKGLRRTEEILSTTRQMLIDEGAEALTMRRIAAKLDMSLSNLQHYFSTKGEKRSDAGRTTMRFCSIHK